MSARRQTGQVKIRVKTVLTKKRRGWTQLVNVLPAATAKSQPSVTAKAGPSYTAAGFLDHEVEGNNANSAQEKTYYQKRTTEIEEWTKIREKLVEVRVAMEIPQQWNCVVCAEATNTPIRCYDCGPFMQCCVKCELSVHRNTLHKPDIWKVSNNNCLLLLCSYLWNEKYGIIFVSWLCICWLQHVVS
jgi:hypothetical protein